MKKIQIIISVFLFTILLASSFVFSQETGKVVSLSLHDAIKMALNASEDLQISNNEVKQQQSEQKEELSYVLPQFSGSIQWANNFQYPHMATTAAVRDYEMDFGVTASQTLFTFGKISSAVAAAKRAVEASRYDKESTEQGIIYNTKLAYYNVCLSKRTLEIAQESYENAKENKEILEDRSSQGRVSKYDNIKISADISSRLPIVSNARADFASAMDALKVAIGADKKDVIQLTEGFAQMYLDFDRNEMAMLLYNHQPAIRALEKIIDQKRSLIISKRAALFPDISAFVTWNRKGASNSHYVENSDMNDYGVAGLKIDIPIWSGGFDREKLYQAKLDKQEADLEYQKGKKDYLLLLDQALSKYQEYRNTLKADIETLHWAEEFFKYSQELLGVGQISLTDLNDAELQWTRAKINKEMTLFNLSVTLAQIERLTLIGSADE
ncbi:MAG: TolC family protein [Candidatus Omnitrophica bacterium]|nr:TolC family protein [Candidatus Omnitrophota bacterium]